MFLHYPKNGDETVSVHRDILPEVMHAIQEHHQDCSIILIGSVAREEERPDSDLDLNIFLPDRSVNSPWVSSENRWQLQVKCVMHDVRIDVAWETFDFLEKHLKTDGPFWILSFGETVYDPSGRVEPCLKQARAWAREHAELCRTMEDDFRIFKKEQIARRRQQQ